MNVYFLFCFYILHKKIQDGLEKMAENRFLGKLTSRLQITWGSKSLYLALFPKENAFCAEIQDGHQNFLENDFWGKSPVDSADTLRVKNFHQNLLSFLHSYRDKCVFVLYAEIQDGRQ